MNIFTMTKQIGMSATILVFVEAGPFPNSQPLSWFASFHWPINYPADIRAGSVVVGEHNAYQKLLTYLSILSWYLLRLKLISRQTNWDKHLFKVGVMNNFSTLKHNNYLPINLIFDVNMSGVVDLVVDII